MNYKQSLFSLEFSALDFASPDQKHYAYILEGFDKDWNYVGKKNIASYTNIPPGQYTFKLRYQNAAGIWSPGARTIQIIIVPPFWLTWWFKLLAILFIAGSIYSLFRYRIERIKTQKVIVERLVEERTRRLEKLTIDERESRKAAEKAWMEAQNAHKALADIAFMQAHGLRRPLASIMGLVNVIKEANFECDPECWSNLEKACEELDEKIHSVLDQIEKGS